MANVQYNQASAAAGGLVGLALLVGLGFLVKRKASSAGLSSMLRRKSSTFKSFDNDLNQSDDPGQMDMGNEPTMGRTRSEASTSTTTG